MKDENIIVYRNFRKLLGKNKDKYFECKICEMQELMMIDPGKG